MNGTVSRSRPSIPYAAIISLIVVVLILGGAWWWQKSHQSSNLTPIQSKRAVLSAVSKLPGLAVVKDSPIDTKMIPQDLAFLIFPKAANIKAAQATMDDGKSGYRITYDIGQSLFDTERQIVLAFLNHSSWEVVSEGRKDSFGVLDVQEAQYAVRVLFGTHGSGVAVEIIAAPK